MGERASTLLLILSRVKLMSSLVVTAETFGWPRRKTPLFMRSMEKCLEMVLSPVAADL